MPDKDGRKHILEISTADIPLDRQRQTVEGFNSDYVDLDKIADLSDGFSGADVASIANTASSLVMHEFLAKHPDPKDAEKHADTAKITMSHFEQAVRKVKIQKKIKVDVNVNVIHYA
jgi:transitional endoplasmic reticulum ATPase